MFGGAVGFFLLLLLTVSPCFLSGQGLRKMAGIPVAVYSVEQGLGQSMVKQALQDKEGLLWLATGGGLQCFDGTHFRSFGLPEALSHTANGNLIREMTETPSGSLYLTSGSQLLRFSKDNGQFYALGEGDQATEVFGLTLNDRVLCWMSDDGLCWAGETGFEKLKLEFENGHPDFEHFTPLGAFGISGGKLLVAGPDGFFELSPNDRPEGMGFSAKWNLYGRSIDAACSDHAGNIFLLSSGAICSLGPDGLVKELFDTGEKELNYIYADRQGRFWLSASFQNLFFRVAGRQMEEVRFLNLDGNRNETFHAQVLTVFEDRRGNFWFCTDGQGLLCHSPSRVIFDRAMTGFTRTLAFYNEEVWAGTFANGLWRLSPDLGSAKRVGAIAPGRELNFFDLAADTLDRLWTATDQGIYLLNAKEEAIASFPVPTVSAKFLRLPGNKMLLSNYDKLYECEMGRRPGLTFIRFQTKVREVELFGNAYWVASHFGLHRTDTVLGISNALFFPEKGKLTSVPVYSLLSMDEKIWAGTENGILCFSSSGAKLPLPACFGELKNEMVYALLADNQKRIWFAGTRGIGCVPKRRDRLIRFGRYNNLQSLEFNFNAKLAIDGKRIYFGGISGINALDADAFVDSGPGPDVGLVSLFVDDTAFTAGIPARLAALTLNWRSPHFGGRVFTPDYLPDGSVSYSFFLEGWDGKWSQPDQEAEFSYRKLPPGRYSLHARCLDFYGNKGPVRTLLTVNIPPPFWKTRIFHLFSIIAPLLLLLLLARWLQVARNRKIIRQLEHTNAVDRERLRISQDMHDEIGSNLTQIAILSELARKNRDNPLEMARLIERISDISGNVVDGMGEIIWAMNPGNDSLSGFVSYLRQHASEFLDTAGINASFLFPEPCPEVAMTSVQRRNIYLVIKEAIHNAVKHSEASRVRIEISFGQDNLVVEVEDNGKGFDETTGRNRGNGLPGMRKRIDALNGSLIVNTGVGRGTQVRFKVNISHSKTT